jgi:hypothetical protein
MPSHGADGHCGGERWGLDGGRSCRKGPFRHEAEASRTPGGGGCAKPLIVKADGIMVMREVRGAKSGRSGAINRGNIPGSLPPDLLHQPCHRGAELIPYCLVGNR